MRRNLLFAVCISSALLAPAQKLAFCPDFEAQAVANISTGDFAPYFISSLQHGKYTQKYGALLDAKIQHKLDLQPRFSWGYGAELIGGYTSHTDYARWSDGQWTAHSEGPAVAWLQQLYGELKYRGVFLTVGMKEHGPALMNPELSSGDFVESGNARPIPEVRVGFVDFQDIPFTQGWVQIQGEIGYGKMMDNSYLRNHYNYYNYHITENSLYNYKRCFFRSNPDQPLSVTAGMQAACLFGGTAYYYNKGEYVKTLHYSSSLKTMLKVFIPTGDGGEGFYSGSHLGSWDFQARYRLRSDDEIIAYFQWPWEDGSSIGRRNQLDGIWGLEYKAARQGIVTGAVIEYIDFRSQCGPIHYAPGDFDNPPVADEATGMDNYYNNASYNSYAYYGMSIGTPFLLSPIYNRDSYPAFVSTRANGFHIGVMGKLLPDLSYKLLVGYQRALGTYQTPFYTPRTCTAVMAQAAWKADQLMRGLSIKAQLEIDGGSLRGNNFGTLVTFSYSGKL